MEKYLLIYNYSGQYENFTIESSSKKYLTSKLFELVSEGYDINYKILKVVTEGTLKYENEEEEL